MTNPYAPPTVDVGPELESVTTYRSSRMPSLLLRGSLAACAVVSVLTIGFSFARLAVFERIKRGSFTIAEVEASDAQAAMLGGLFLLVFVATVITWIVWQQRTSLNARALGTDFMQFGPKAWGWFFCPFINLYRPLAVVTELWQVSDPESSDTNAPGFFGLWWATWIIGNVLSSAATRMVDEDSNVDEFIFSTQLDMAANVALVASAVVAIKVVAAIQQREQARASKRRVS